MDDGTTTRAALMTNAVVEGAVPRDREHAGASIAAGVLAEEQGVDLRDPDQARLFARAVADALNHREAGGLDFSETSVDVARMTLAAWSLDRLRESGAPGLVPEAEALRKGAYAIEVAVPAEGVESQAVRFAMLDDYGGGFTRDAILASASSADGHRWGKETWEDRLPAGPSDDERGFAPFPSGLVPTKGERDDMIIDSSMDAERVRDEASNGRPGPQANGSFAETRRTVSDGVVAASEARRPFAGSLTPAQRGLLAAEAWHEAKAGRPLRDYEKRMVDSALGRFHASSAAVQGGPRTAARTILLDSAIQMSARRTMDAGDYGTRSSSARQWYDDVIQASAGMDLHRTSIAPGMETTDAIAKGRFVSIPDPAIADSIARGLADASKSYSKLIDAELDGHLRDGILSRARGEAAIRSGEAGLAARGPSDVSKGPQDAAPVLGSWVGRDGGRG